MVASSNVDKKKALILGFLPKVQSFSQKQPKQAGSGCLRGNAKPLSPKSALQEGLAKERPSQRHGTHNSELRSAPRFDMGYGEALVRLCNHLNRAKSEWVLGAALVAQTEGLQNTVW